MQKPNNHSTLPEIIRLLKENPQILNKDLSNPAISVIYSNTRKRFTDFHRIRVKEKRNNKKIKELFWIRMVKKRPTNEINQVLHKKFAIMEGVYNYFQKNNDTNVKLSCCQPIAILPECRAIITRECSGQLFNSFLRKHIPLFSKKKTLTHCYNLGIWLRNFHERFKEQTSSKSDLNKYKEQFRNKYNKDPQPDLCYITYCHNDYSPRNVFVADNSVEVIDYVGVDKGIPQADIEFFSNYVLKAKFNLLYSRSFKRQMIKKFNEGYFARSSTINE